MKYLSTAASVVLILVAVLLPAPALPSFGRFDLTGIDKVAHFALFVIWSVAVRHDFEPSFRVPWVLAVGIVFSFFTEVLQLAIEGRTFDIFDLVADGAGLVFGISLGRFLLDIARRILSRTPGK